MIAELLARHHTPVTTVDELQQIIEAAWVAELYRFIAIQPLKDSMPRHMTAISTSGGCSRI